MKKLCSLLLMLTILAITAGTAHGAEETGRKPFDRLVWADEFNGSRINLSSWI